MNIWVVDRFTNMMPEIETPTTKRRRRMAPQRCAIEEMATQEVFAQLPLEEDDDPMIGIQFLELRGDKCFDLLANTKGGEKKNPGAKQGGCSTGF
jgi:hypothetical protein